jgi:hypothetical protein
MFTGSMSTAEMKEGYTRLISTAKNKDPNAKEVKLCYVTVSPYLDLPRICNRSLARQPERIAKSKRFMAVVKTMVDAEKLGEAPRSFLAYLA